MLFRSVARERMALFPARAEVLYIASDIWVVSVPPSSSCSLLGYVCIYVARVLTDLLRARTAGRKTRGQAVRVPRDPEALPAHA